MYVADNSVTKNHLKTLVNYDLEKWSDVNHASCTLGTRLYLTEGKIKGLTPNVIPYIQKSFTYFVNQNKGQPFLLLKGFSSVVGIPGVDTKTLKTRDGSPLGGKDLMGEDLHKTLEEAIRPFIPHDLVKKLAPAGSSRRNKSVNSSISSKVRKTRHYGGSQSSDFMPPPPRIAQFNKGNRYLTLATEKMGRTQTFITRKETHVTLSDGFNSWFLYYMFLSVAAPGSSHSYGSAILFRPRFSLVTSWTDDNGRLVILFRPRFLLATSWIDDNGCFVLAEFPT